MTQGVLVWNPWLQSPLPSLSIPFPNNPTRPRARAAGASPLIISATDLTARERRQLRNERREGTNWREEVEERLMRKPKKKELTWMNELGLDNLPLLGPQWWALRVTRRPAMAQFTADDLARALARNFPDMDFKVYNPVVRVKRKLKNGSYSEKANPVCPGCIFLHCVLNREIYNFVRECNGVGCFVQSGAGTTYRRLIRPKPVPSDDMEEIFKQAKEDQEKADHAFEEERQAEELSINMSTSEEVTTSTKVAKPKRQSKKISEPSDSNPLTGEDHKSLVPGSSVQVLSGPFAEFTGCLKELDHKSRKATVELLLFGKERLVDLDVNEIAAKTMQMNMDSLDAYVGQIKKVIGYHGPSLE